MFDELHEECGVFGVYHVAEAASLTYYGLHALQHRGQEGCGIAVSDGRQVKSHKGRGLISEVFSEAPLQRLSGDIAIGHVRYSTAGGNLLENVQPMLSVSHRGTLAMVHNGQIVNATRLRNALEDAGSIFQGTSDSEIILHLIQRQKGSLLEKIRQTALQLEGAFAFLIMSENSIYAVRDRHGLRPLSYAKVQDGYCISSETCTYDVISGRSIVDVQPGEIVTITKDGIASDMSMAVPAERHARCIFEYIYFARTDSTIDGVNVYHSRIIAGKALAESYPVEADLVVGVPDSGLVAAKGYSEQSGIPYGMAFHKNSYVGRTFIKPKQSDRESSVKIKLNVIPEVVKGKRIVMVDDSIVRGTTCANIIKMLKHAGAEEVHVRISSPPFLYPCYFGTDVPSDEQLIAHSHTPEEIREMIGADSLGYMEVSKLKDMAGGLGYCDACFTGHYPMEVPGRDISHAFE